LGRHHDGDSDADAKARTLYETKQFGRIRDLLGPMRLCLLGAILGAAVVAIYFADVLAELRAEVARLRQQWPWKR
jgi:hypothetical protein